MSIDMTKIQSFWNSRKQRMKELGMYDNADGFDFFTIKDEGEYEIRVLAMADFDSGQHWGLLDGNQGRKGGKIACPRAYDGSPCPVCELVEQLASSAEAKDRKLATDYKVRIKNPIVVYDLNEGSAKPKPRIYEAPPSVFEKILKWFANPKYKNIADYATGRNLTLIRSRDKANFVTYEVQPDPEVSSIQVDESKLPDLRKILKPRSYEDIEYALQYGKYPEKPKGEDSEEQAPKAYGKGLPSTKTEDEDSPPPRAFKKSQPVEEAESEEEEDIIPEEYEKPTPQQFKKRAPSARLTEEEAVPETENPKSALTNSISERLKALRAKNVK